MNVVVFAIFVLVFLTIVIVILFAIFGGKSFSCSTLLEELARERQGKLRSLNLGRSEVELPLSFGSMFVGVWYRSMLGTSSTNPRANISIRPTSFKDIPEFIIHSKFSLSCGVVSGFKKARFSEPHFDQDFDQKWCIFVCPETSTQQINTLLNQLKSPLTNLKHQALSPQWNVVNISCRNQKIDFVYSKPIYATDSLEILMNASVEFVQNLI
jgi:hypothetical protein